MEYADHDPFSSYFDSLSLTELRSYMFQCLTILKGVHALGIIHCDIKPQNLLFCREKNRVTLIDFGRATFYKRDAARSTCIGSKFFKAPEVLFGYKYFDFGVDVWNLGLVFASLVFKVSPFLYFEADSSLLDVVFSIWGDERIIKLISKFKIFISDEVKKKYFNTKGTSLDWFFYTRNARNKNKELYDLLNRMLTVDPLERITAEEALKHPFFKVRVADR